MPQCVSKRYSSLRNSPMWRARSDGAAAVVLNGQGCDGRGIVGAGFEAIDARRQMTSGGRMSMRSART